MEGKGPVRQIVIPGESVGGPGVKPGPGTFGEGGKVYSAHLGVLAEKDGRVSVIPLSGRYIPEPGDAVVGEVVDVGPSHWLPVPRAPPCDGEPVARGVRRHHAVPERRGRDSRPRPER